MTPRERRARFADAARAEADRGAREQPLVPGSEAAHELSGLVGDSLLDIVRDRLAGEQGSTGSEAA